MALHPMVVCMVSRALLCILYNYHFSGFYHQGGELGVPVFDDGDWFKVSYRTWGQIMADAYPEEMTQAKSSYTVWAWCSPCEPKDMILPRRNDYPDFEFWEGPFPVNDSTFI